MLFPVLIVFSLFFFLLPAAAQNLLLR